MDQIRYNHTDNGGFTYNLPQTGQKVNNLLRSPYEDFGERSSASALRKSDRQQGLVRLMRLASSTHAYSPWPNALPPRVLVLPDRGVLHERRARDSEPGTMSTRVVVVVVVMTRSMRMMTTMTINTCCLTLASRLSHPALPLSSLTYRWTASS